MKIAHRKLLMAALVGSFAVQTLLVYTDSTAEATLPLEGAALRGRKIWLRHNCQACHQIHGFGGFLGPDLTNAASRLNRERLDSILSIGFGQMPAFQFKTDQISDLEAYLTALDRTGVGQARRTGTLAAADILVLIEEHRAAHPMTEAASLGWARYTGICSACHVLFQSTPLGPNSAPDLSDAVQRLRREEIEHVLVAGRIERGMPPFGLPEDQRLELLGFLEWVGENRDELVQKSRSRLRSDAPLPWFEFE